MKKPQIILCMLIIVSIAALSPIVYASLKSSGDPARCNIYLRAIETENLCTVEAPHLALTPARPGEAPLMTIYATAISGPCQTYHEVYSCY